MHRDDAFACRNPRCNQMSAFRNFHTLITWLCLHLHAWNIRKHNFVFPNVKAPDHRQQIFYKISINKHTKYHRKQPLHFVNNQCNPPKEFGINLKTHTIHSFDSVIHQPWNKKCWQRHEWTYWLIMCDCSCSFVCVISVRWSGEINMISWDRGLVD